MFLTREIAIVMFNGALDRIGHERDRLPRHCRISVQPYTTHEKRAGSEPNWKQSRPKLWYPLVLQKETRHTHTYAFTHGDERLNVRHSPTKNDPGNRKVARNSLPHTNTQTRKQKYTNTQTHKNTNTHTGGHRAKSCRSTQQGGGVVRS